MKRILAVLLTAILLISCLPLSAMAAATDTAPVSSASIEQKFKLLLEDMELDPTIYRADRYFYEELAQYPQDDPEWVLIRAGLSDIRLEHGETAHHGTLGNKHIDSSGISSPFSFDFGVYDVKKNAFYDLVDAWSMDFTDLRSVWNSLPGDIHQDGLAANKFLIGDADNDGEITILDATRVQRILADLEAQDWDLTHVWDWWDLGVRLGAECDYDRDGELTILDATKLQRSVAELPNILESKELWDERIYPDVEPSCDAELINSRDELDPTDKYHKMALDECDEAFFADKSLLLVKYSLESGSLSLTFKNAALDQDGVLNVNFDCRYPRYNSMTADINGRFIGIRISKAFVDDITDIKVNVNKIIVEPVTGPVDAELVMDIQTLVDWEETEAQLLTNRTDLLSFAQKYGKKNKIPAEYDDAYFNTHALVGVFTVLGSGCYYFTGSAAKLDESGTLHLSMTYTSDYELITDDENPRFALVEIPADYNDSISDVRPEFNYCPPVKPSLVAEIPRVSEQMTIPVNMWAEDYIELNTSPLAVSAPSPYMLDLCGSPFESSVYPGYVMLVRSRADFEQYLPGFDTEKKLDDAWFEENAVLGMLGHANNGADFAYIGHTACRYTTLYLEAYVDSPDYIKESGTEEAIDMPVWTLLQVKKSDVYPISELKVWHSTGAEIGALCIEEPRRAEKKEIPDQYWNEGYTGVGATQIEMSVPSDLSWDALPLKRTDTGYLMLIRSRAELEYYLPGFDKERKYSNYECFDKGYAILAYIGQGNDASSYATIGLSATKGDRLYVYCETKNNQKVNGQGAPIAQPSAPIVCAFQRMRTKDIASVKLLRCWASAYPTYNADIPFTVIEDHRPEIGGLTEKNAAYFIDDKTSVHSQISKLYFDENGRSVERDDHTFIAEELPQDWFASNSLIAMRIYQGGGNTQVSVDRVSRTGENVLTVEVSHVYDSEPSTPDSNWRMIFLSIPNYEKYFLIRLDVKDVDEDSFVASVVNYGSGPNYHTASADAVPVSSVRAFRGQYQSLGWSQDQRNNCAFTRICEGKKGDGFLAIVKTVDQFKDLFRDEYGDMIPTVRYLKKYDEAYFEDKALVVLVYEIDNYTEYLDLSHLGVIGNKLYGEMIVTEPNWNQPAYDIFFDAQEVNKSDIKGVTSTALWTNPYNEHWYSFSDYYKESAVPQRPDDLSGYTAIRTEEVGVYTVKNYNGIMYSGESGIKTALTYNRDQLWMMTGTVDGLNISDDDYDHYLYFSVISNGKYAGDSVDICGVYAYNDGKYDRVAVDAAFHNYREDSGEPAPELSPHVTIAIHRIRKSYLLGALPGVLKDWSVELWNTSQEVFEQTITDNEKLDRAYHEKLEYENLPTVTKKFEAGSFDNLFLSQPYRVAIIRSFEQYNAYFTEERFPSAAGISENKPVYQVIDGRQTEINEDFFKDNALIVGVGYFAYGDEYLSFDEIQNDYGVRLIVRFNRYTYGDLHPGEPYAAPVLGYTFAAARVSKKAVQNVTSVYMLPEVKKLPE